MLIARIAISYQLKGLKLLNILRPLHLLQITASSRSHARNEIGQTNIALGFAEEFRVSLAGVTLEDAVHFFQGCALGFGQEEPDPGDADQEESREEDVSAPFPGLKHGRYEEGDGEVVDPVAGRAD